MSSSAAKDREGAVLLSTIAGDDGTTGSSGDGGVTKEPIDASRVRDILNNVMDVESYEPQVVNQLLEFTHRTSLSLSDLVLLFYTVFF